MISLISSDCEPYGFERKRHLTEIIYDSVADLKLNVF